MQGSRSLIQRASDTLADHDDVRRIRTALGHLERALDDGLWIDEVHADGRPGLKVFHEAASAVIQLEQLIASPPNGPQDELSAEAREWAIAAMNDISFATGLLAEIRVEESADLEVDNARRQRSLDLANERAAEQLELGVAALDGGDLSGAIEHFGKAWRLAMSVAQVAAR